MLTSPGGHGEEQKEPLENVSNNSMLQNQKDIDKIVVSFDQSAMDVYKQLFTPKMFEEVQK